MSPLSIVSCKPAQKALSPAAFAGGASPLPLSACWERRDLVPTATVPDRASSGGSPFWDRLCRAAGAALMTFRSDLTRAR